MEFKKNRLRTRDIAAAVIVAMFFSSFLEMRVLPHLPWSPAVVSSCGQIVEYGVMLWLVGYVASKAHLPMRAVFGKNPSTSFFTIAVFYGLAIIFFSLGENFVEVYLTAQNAPEFAYRYWNFHVSQYELTASLAGYVLLILAQFIAGPIAEEYVFRGVLLKAWSRRLGLGVSIVATSLVFAAMHYSRHYFLSTFVFGVLMCVLYIKYDSLWVNSLTHGFMNFFAFLLEFVSNFHWNKSSGQLALLSSWLPEVLMLLASTPILAYLIVKNWPKKWPGELADFRGVQS